MSRQDRLRWEADGSPWRLMTPLADLRDVLRRYGYTVYDIGNRDHLEADPPEDHTPYSETGWPGDADYGVGYAIDIMPPDDPDLPSLQQLGAQLYADRQHGIDGIQWLKYMNWEPERDNGGACWHDSWEPDHARRSSSDRGHIHVSGRTGYESSTIGRGYDPVARIRGDEMTDEQARELHAAFTALFYGGSSCGPTVPPEFRVAGEKSTGNAVVDQLAYLRARLDAPASPIDYDKLAAALLRQIAKA